jgi:hypothetical protein
VKPAVNTLMSYQTRWLTYLNWIGEHPAERENQRAICILLGHEPSGERLMTNPHLDICRHCADMFR